MRTLTLRNLLLLAGLLLSVTASHLAYAEPASNRVENEQITVRLLADHASLAAGQTFQLGLQLEPSEGWHTYWRNPGDSGLPIRIQWTLPPGVTAGDIQWPTPQAAAVGGMMNYGYEQPALLVVPLTLANNISTETIHIAATANWLVCADSCIPQQGNFSLSLPVGELPSKANQQLFADARKAMPTQVAANGQIRMVDGHARLHWKPTDIDFTTWTKLRLFPLTTELIDHAAAQAFLTDGEELYASVMQNEYFSELPAQTSWLLKATDRAGHAKAWQFTAQRSSQPFWPADNQLSRLTLFNAPSADQLAGSLPRSAATGSETKPALNLLMAILLAIIGGLVLNLMPCVLPVLSLKLLSIAKAQGQALAMQRKHALAYGCGVLLSFLAVAGLLLALRAAGDQIGWGFQLQAPWFVAGLVYLMVALGLSMSGVVLFGQRLMGTGEQLTAKDGSAGSFFTGVLAVVVASPCSAPFMGSALGWAINQPPLAALSVFTGLGIGMALPMVLIAWWPWAARLLPKPGIWMERLKQALAFPLYLTAVWLLWVLGQQVSQNGVAMVLGGAVLLALSLWILGLKQRGEGGLKSSLIALAALLIACVPLTQLQPQNTANAAITLEQQSYSAEKLQTLLDNNKPVFVDMTAAWCITCQFNERRVLQQPDVQEAFTKNGVTQMVGDWTNRDPAITAFLESHNRNGVPLYVFYDAAGQATVLPQVLVKNQLIKLVQSK